MGRTRCCPQGLPWCLATENAGAGVRLFRAHDENRIGPELAVQAPDTHIEIRSNGSHFECPSVRAKTSDHVRSKPVEDQLPVGRLHVRASYVQETASIEWIHTQTAHVVVDAEQKLLLPGGFA